MPYPIPQLIISNGDFSWYRVLHANKIRAFSPTGLSDLFSNLFPKQCSGFFFNVSLDLFLMQDFPTECHNQRGHLNSPTVKRKYKTLLFYSALF